MKNKVIWALVALILILAAIPVSLIIYTHNVMNWKIAADFENYSAEFNLVKDYIKSIFPNEADKYVTVVANKGDKILLYDPDTSEYLSVPDDVEAALRLLRDKAFCDKDANFDIIRIHNERILFCIEKGYYAVVYSPDEKPTWLRYNHRNDKDDNPVIVKSLGNGWYHVHQ